MHKLRVDTIQLLDPSVSALPIIVKQNLPSIGSSTNREHELGLDRRETG